MHFNVIVQSKNRAIIIIQRVQIQYQTIGSKVRFRNFKKKKKIRKATKNRVISREHDPSSSTSAKNRYARSTHESYAAQ